MTREMQPAEAPETARDAFVFGFPFAANHRFLISTRPYTSSMAEHERVSVDEEHAL
jgi:hypothetical protein